MYRNNELPETHLLGIGGVLPTCAATYGFFGCDDIQYLQIESRKVKKIQTYFAWLEKLNATTEGLEESFLIR